MNSVKFTKEIVQILSEGLFSDEYLLREEDTKNSNEYFQILASKIQDTDSAQYLVIDYFLKKFQQSKTSSLSVIER